MKLAVFTSPDPNCGDHLPWVFGSGAPWAFTRTVHPSGVCSIYGFSSTPFTGYDLTTDYLLGTDGKIYHWNGTTLEGPAYIFTDWGINSRIAGWADGLYEALPNTASSLKVVPVTQ